MKLTTEILDLQLRHTFTISRGSQDVSQVVGVRLSYNDVVGTGEACPSDYYHETPESIVQALERLGPWLADKSPLEYRHFLERAAEKLGPQRAALSALDLAVHDWFGRRLGQPLYRIFGLDLKRTPQTSFTIGIDRVENMLEKIREAREFPVIKIMPSHGVQFRGSRPPESSATPIEDRGPQLRQPASCPASALGTCRTGAGADRPSPS